MHAVCPTCQSRVPGWAIDLGLMTATCEVCHTMFDCAAELPQRLRRYEAPKLPAGVSIEVTGHEESAQLGLYRSESPLVSGRMRIRLRRVPLRFVLGMFGIALLWWWLSWPQWFEGMWPALVSLSFGLFLTGWGLDSARPIEIVADRDMLTVRRAGPLSLRAGTRLRTSTLRRIFIIEQPPGTHDHGERTLYSIHARTADGQTTKLIDDIFEPEVAVVVERRLTDHLGLRPLGSGG